MTATKTSLKKWISTASDIILLIPSRLIRQILTNSLKLNSKVLYQSSGKGKESWCLVFPSLTNREIGHFHVVVVQWQQRNVQKSVMHIQSSCFANLNQFLFCHFCWRHHHCCLSSLMKNLLSDTDWWIKEQYYHISVSDKDEATKSSDTVTVQCTL